MWYDTLVDDWIGETEELYDILLETADNNREMFALDDFIDDIYPSMTFFGQKFFVSEIIKKLDVYLYKDILENLEINWVEDVLYRLERLELKDGENLATLLDENLKELESIVWRNKNDEL